MWETAIFYFNNFPDLAAQLNLWAQDHAGVEMKNYRHQASDDLPRGVNMWMFDFKKIGS